MRVGLRWLVSFMLRWMGWRMWSLLVLRGVGLDSLGRVRERLLGLRPEPFREALLREVTLGWDGIGFPFLFGGRRQLVD